MAEADYAIEDFPDDDLLRRIEWIGGVAYNTVACQIGNLFGDVFDLLKILQRLDEILQSMSKVF
jgi:hypothetical protein